MKIEHIEKLLKLEKSETSKWELDNIIYWDRANNPATLIAFLKKVKELQTIKNPTNLEKEILQYHLELLGDLDLDECQKLLEEKDDDEFKNRYIENLARNCAIETLTSGKISFESMNTACKLSPNDFILCAKRTQDLITAIHGLVIKGETLSKDVGGA